MIKFRVNFFTAIIIKIDDFRMKENILFSPECFLIAFETDRIQQEFQQF